MRVDTRALIEQIQKDAIPFTNTDDLDVLIEKIGDAKYVLLGEATHGTSEFYTIRAEITKKLIEKKGFSFLAVEGDWPSCYSLNRYIKGEDDNQKGIRDVMQDFSRWPTWMWANEEIVELGEWLREHNRGLHDQRKVGFYGLDVYSLWESLDEIIKHLEKTGSPELQTAKEVFSCFEPYEREGQKYAVAASFFSTDCENEVVELLTKLASKRQLSNHESESTLNMELNALVAHNAEKYYRTMIKSDSESWNVRDHHMVEVLNRLMKFHGGDAKAIIWEHNTHIGDARATDMVDDGMINVGQLVREQNEEHEVFVVGFGTHRGTVIAAKGWGAPLEEMKVPPARKGSWEDVMHQTVEENKILIFPKDNPIYEQEIGHRAIGVVYYPQYESGNYVPTIMSKRYDAFIHIDQTHGVHPLALEKVFV